MILKMKWPALEKEVRVHLLDRENPSLCADLKKRLPLKSVQSHAVVCGEQMYFPYAAPEIPPDAYWEDMAQQPVGRLNIEPTFHYMSLNYGPNHEAVQTLAVGQVEEADFETLKQVGRLIWNNLLFSVEYIYVILEEA